MKTQNRGTVNLERFKIMRIAYPMQRNIHLNEEQDKFLRDNSLSPSKILRATIDLMIMRESTDKVNQKGKSYEEKK